MTITTIGLGLMGGSLALDLRKKGIATRIYGVDHNALYCNEAIELGIVDEVQDLATAVGQSELVILAIPVDAAKNILLEVLDILQDDTTVMDLGSTKSGICEAVRGHKNRAQYVACHPMAGTEFSGPSAAHLGLFNGKVSIMCDVEESSTTSLTLVEEVFKALNMKILHMNADDHDRHVAYVSHLSHVTSFTLGLTVLDIEKNERNIFNMASSGFASTVRLAKSSPEMWGPIFRQNANYLLEALDAYMAKLNQFREVIAEQQTGKAEELMVKGNEIKRILDGIELKNKETTN